METVTIRPRFVVWTGDGYEIAGNPGVGLGSLFVGRTITDDDFERYHTISKTAKDIDVPSSCDIAKLKLLTFSRLEVNPKLASDSVVEFLYIAAANELCCCRNESLSIGEIIARFDDASMPYALVRLSRVAGEVLSGVLDGVRLSIRPKEQRHQRAHMHVDHKHTVQASVDIRTGEFIVSNGRIPGNIKYAIKELVKEKESALLKYWGCGVNGLDFDVCTSLGITPIKNATS